MIRAVVLLCVVGFQSVASSQELTPQEVVKNLCETQVEEKNTMAIRVDGRIIKATRLRLPDANRVGMMLTLPVPKTLLTSGEINRAYDVASKHLPIPGLKYEPKIREQLVGGAGVSALVLDEKQYQHGMTYDGWTGFCKAQYDEASGTLLLAVLFEPSPKK